MKLVSSSACYGVVPRVVSTGGGAFINERTRAAIQAGGTSLWLKSDLEVLWERVNKRDNRPLPEKRRIQSKTLKNLMELRYPIYEKADITVQSRDVRKEQVAGDVLSAFYLRQKKVPHHEYLDVTG